MSKRKFDPKEPMLKAINRLNIEPFYPSDEVRRKAESDPELVLIGQMDAYAILSNDGCKNQAEIDAKKGGAR